MRTVTPDPDDLTARARIRDAAVALIARDGADVGLRAIAEKADVSLGLIRHHFGSKDGLRAACDEWVLARFADLQRQQAGAADPIATMLTNTDRADEFRPLIGYVLAAVRHGGAFAQHLVGQMAADAEQYLARLEEAGLVRPSVDPAGRARHLVVTALGTLLVEHAVAAAGTDPWEQYLDRTTVPALELYARGLFTDERMLDAHLDQGGPS